MWRAWSTAACTDSSRTIRPSGVGKAAQSPSAEIAGSPVSSRASTTTPLPTARPAASASSTFGRTPAASTNEVAGHRGGRRRGARRPARSPRPRSPSSTRAPMLGVRREEVGGDLRRHHPAHQPVGGLDHVTSSPAARATAANSRPMKPPPITTAERRGRRGGRAAPAASARVRSPTTPDASSPAIGGSRVARPGGEHQMVVGERRAVAVRTRPRGAVDLGHAGPRAVVDRVASRRRRPASAAAGWPRRPSCRPWRAAGAGRAGRARRRSG